MVKRGLLDTDSNANRRGFFGTEGDVYASVWAEFDDLRSPNFFSDIQIAPDGGFSEVKDLWSPGRWVTAAVTVFFLVSNLYYTVYVDLLVLFSSEPADKLGNLLIEAVAERAVSGFNCAMGRPGVTLPVTFSGEHVVALLEMSLTTFKILQTLWYLYVGRTGKTEQQRWFATEIVWWDLVPNLYTYSAMRYLHYVSPQVLMMDISRVLRSPTQWRSYFILSRLACLVVGFDAFLLKVRKFSRRIGDDILVVWSMWAAFMFMKQVLGIVQIGMYVRDRLFIFMFAGEDAIMDKLEGAKLRVWNAMLVREIFQTHRGAKAVAIMLSFDDNDFQRLVLNECPERTGPTAASSRELTDFTDDEDSEDSVSTQVL